MLDFRNLMDLEMTTHARMLLTIYSAAQDHQTSLSSVLCSADYSVPA